MPPPTEAGHRKQLGPHLPGAVPSTLPNPTFTSTPGQSLGRDGPGGRRKERGRPRGVCLWRESLEVGGIQGIVSLAPHSEGSGWGQKAA